MKKKSRAGNQSNSPQHPPRKRSIGIAIAIALLAIAGLGGWAWGRYRNASPPAAEPASTARPEPAAPGSGAVPPADADYQKLIGRWQRLDGGYVLEIRSVKTNGTLDAAYYNPSSINVAKAEVSRDGKTLKVFVELRDRNYPGSTYQLQYDPQAAQLGGTYFQAVARQNFDVTFERMK